MIWHDVLLSVLANELGTLAVCENRVEGRREEHGSGGVNRNEGGIMKSKQVQCSRVTGSFTNENNDARH